jgi:hypothetical protein
MISPFRETSLLERLSFAPDAVMPAVYSLAVSRRYERDVKELPE